MFFFHKDRTPQSQDKPVNTVKLFLGDYYRDYGELYSGGKHLICVMPYYEDGDRSFRHLMRSLGAELLSSFPFVLEQLLGDQFQRSQGRWIFRKPRMERANLLQEAYISEYQSRGGQVRCREKGDLIALSEFDGPKLLPLIPVGGLAAVSYCGYGAHEMPYRHNGRRAFFCPLTCTAIVAAGYYLICNTILSFRRACGRLRFLLYCNNIILYS